MSYLAFNAAPIQDDNINGSANDKKRNARNKTLKKYNSNGRVADVINQIHKSSLLNDDENELGDFNLPLPESAGNQRKADNETKPQQQQPQPPQLQMQQHQDQSQGKWQGTTWHQNASSSSSYAPYPLQYQQPQQLNKRQQPQQQPQPQQDQENKEQGSSDEPVNIDGFQNLENSDVGSSPFLQKLPYYNQMSLGGSVPNRDELLTKLNYMIHILEEQQDQKTGHVTEEVVLYSFLGIFIIFVIDSFARAGKYVR
jgi:hypothetical protein